MTDHPLETPQGPPGPMTGATRGVALVVGAVCAVLSLSGVGMVGLSQRTGDILEGPGDVHPTEAAVSVVSGAPADPVQAETMFVTVSQREATRFDTLIGRRLDPSLELLSRREVYGTVGKKRVDTYNSRAMVDSKLVAQIAAMRQLDKPVRFTGKGCVVQEIVPKSPAAAAMKVGDVIHVINGEKIGTTEDLRRVLNGVKVGQRATFGLTRDGKELTVAASLIANPDAPSKAMVGIVPDTVDFDVVLPVKLRMESGNVTGPSAGLAWTLAIVDRLTPGDLSNGVTYAATGEIAVDGSVGRIGGLPQKAVAVDRAGVKDFLVPADTPADDLAAARKLVGHHVTFHRVGTLDAALRVVRSLRT